MPTLDRIAPELQHMIFAVVNRPDIANLRLTCKTLAEVGAHYTFERLRLSFSTKSFQKLETISQLPVRHCVKNLDYNVWEVEEHSLESFRDDPDLWVPLELPPEPSVDAPDRDWRAWRRCFPKGISLPRNMRQSKKELRRHRAQLLDQQSLRDINYGQTNLNAAIAQLVNLKHLELSMDREYDSYDPFGSRESGPSYGVPQIVSVFQAINTAGMTLESLESWSINWRIFEIEEHQFQTMKRVVSSVKSIVLDVVTHEEAYDDILAVACAKMFRLGRPLEFFQSMPHLQVLHVSGEAWYDGVERIDLKHVVGKFCWPHLRKISFNGLQTGSGELLDFCRRHAVTLRFVTLENIKIAPESWPYIFHNLRTSLKLKDFSFGYNFRNHWDYEGAWEMQAYVLKKINMSFDELVEACKDLLESED